MGGRCPRRHRQGKGGRVNSHVMHSPLPWTVRRTGRRGDSHIVAADGVVIGRMYADGGDEAEFAVRMMNQSHLFWEALWLIVGISSNETDAAALQRIERIAHGVLNGTITELTGQTGKATS